MRETPKTFRCAGIVGCILLLAVFGGCAGLPDYALPRSGAAMAFSTETIVHKRRPETSLEP